MSSESRGLQDQLREKAIDVRNEIITQSANTFLMARRALMASLGAVALTIDDGNQFIDTLIERGEVAEADVHKLVSDFRAKSNTHEEKARAARKSMAEKATLALEDSVDVILNRFNVPTKNDIEDLSQKITKLTEKIAALKTIKDTE